MREVTMAGMVLSLLAACAPMDGFSGQEPAVPAVTAPAPVASYCYQTLGGVDCYRTPRPGDPLVGVDVQPPR